MGIGQVGGRLKVDSPYLNLPPVSVCHLPPGPLPCRVGDPAPTASSPADFRISARIRRDTVSRRSRPVRTGSR